MPALYPEDRLYHRDALWLKLLDNGEALVGVNYYAQQTLGEVVYLDLPKAGESICLGTSMGTIESHKAVSDLISPVSGSVLGINPRLQNEPALINSDPYGDGWLLLIRLEAPDGTGHLLAAGDYLEYMGIAE